MSRLRCCVFITAVVFITMMHGCGRGGGGEGNVRKMPDSSVVEVIVSPVRVTCFEDWGSYSADLRGIEDANLTAPYQGGRVAMVKEVGTEVTAGESLCDIDKLKYQASLKAATAQVAVTRGDLERARVNVAEGSLGRSALDAAELAWNNARMAEASAKRAYDDCRCSAPFDGIIVSRSIDKFQTVEPGRPTVRVARIDRLEAVITIPETEVFTYDKGMKTEFRLIRDSVRIYTGKLTSIDMAVDPGTRSAVARIVIENRNQALKPGMIGRVRILRSVYWNVIVVPSTALVHEQNGISVMIVRNGVARKRKIEIRLTAGENSLLSSGLSPGDTLITSGAFEVTDGTRVRYGGG